ncbi:unnamed protein product [Sphenostylis stenocarpa]|uniref:Uncharacterized protein n=1 Tax=Sphenostylis stenocarpa TaxID=92480 RepID=A0AA86TKI2_9FABA|nr:unnamed protein product [Sphenostylis stenocarpa]
MSKFPLTVNFTEAIVREVKGDDEIGLLRFEFVAAAFRDASLADFIWESKLPLNYKFIVEKALKDVSVEDSGKRDIYARLCRPNLFDNGTKEIWLDKRTGGMCMAISSQALRITGIDDT